MTTALATVDGEVIEEAPRAPMTLFGTDDPSAVVERASTVATALASVINERRLYTSIGQKKHVQVEGWTLLGSMLGVFAEVEWSRPLDNGWEARAVARTLSGNVVGAAEAMCTVNEGRWKSADPYAVRSMAQTRAVSKALRLPLGFIMHLAGYSATPAEELVEDQPDRPRGPAQAASDPYAAGPVQSDGKLRDAVAAAALEHGLSNSALSLMADRVGVPKGTRANADQLRAILELIDTPSSGAPEPPGPGLPSVAPADTPSSEAATVPAEAVGLVSPPSAAPASEGLLDSILEVTGGELVHPEPGTDEYKALTAQEKAAARAYWQQQGVTA